MARVLKSVTFVYVPREDRILAAINAGRDDAWSCWLTRRLALAVIERATDYVASGSQPDAAGTRRTARRDGRVRARRGDRQDGAGDVGHLGHRA